MNLQNKLMNVSLRKEFQTDSGKTGNLFQGILFEIFQRQNI